jgi:hypothetical protein
MQPRGDILKEEKPFAALRTKLPRGAASFYGRLEALLEGQPDPTARAALGRAYNKLGELTEKIGFCSFSYPQPIPPNAGGYDIHPRPLDPFSGRAGHDNFRASVGSTKHLKRLSAFDAFLYPCHPRPVNGYTKSDPEICLYSVLAITSLAELGNVFLRTTYARSI